MAKKSASLVRKHVVVLKPRWRREPYLQRTPAWPHTERNRHAAANPHICRELCLPFPWQVFLGNQSKAFVRLPRLAFDYWLVTQTKNSKLL
jgi:hypothetical protein